MSSDPNSPTIVFRADNAIEAGAIVTALAGEGIETTTTGSYTSGFQAEAPGQVQVVVRQSQAEQARQVIKRFQQEAEMNEEEDE